MLGKYSGNLGGVNILIVFDEGFVVGGGPLRVQLSAVARSDQVVGVVKGDLFLRFFDHAILVTSVVSRELGGRHEGAVNGC